MKTININLVGERAGTKLGLGGLGRLNLDLETLAPGIAAVVLALIVPSILVWAIDFGLVGPANAHIETLQGEIGTNHSKASQLAKVERQSKALEADYNALMALSHQGATWKTVLEQLRDFTPTDLWLTHMAIGRNNKLRLEGNALQYQAIAYLYTNLQNSTVFVRPVLGPLVSADTLGQPLVSFTIDCELIPPKGGN